MQRKRDIILNQLAEGDPSAIASSPTATPISTPDTSTPSTATTPSPSEEEPVIVIADDEPTMANSEEIAAIDEDSIFPLEEAEATAI
ncbi:hypothetical protein QYE76_063311 [Lolium multiflorum]|uniref:Uncharacterized protein n=1 Tax=Lolium multiflorum TaxID=4521 RepID=A0AAD8S5X2_LOLMU|nr:hypothetical protein QYE76_063311 [Lolium multiflorum]